VFLAGHSSRMVPTREAAIARFTALSGGLGSAEATRLTLALALALTGWNKALGAVDHVDPAMRSRERADLDSWTRHFDPS
jgi:hypothetical protein